MRETAERAQELRSLPTVTAVDRLRHICESLVDCFAAAGEELDDVGLRDAAVQIAEEGLMEARVLAPKGVPEAAINGPQQWVRIHRRAGIPATARALAREFANYTGTKEGTDARTTTLGLRMWFGGSEAVVADAVTVAQTLIRAGEWDRLEQLRQRLWNYQLSGRPSAEGAATEEVLALLASASGEKAGQARRAWRWSRYNEWAYLRNDDLPGAERVAREGAAVQGLNEVSGASLVNVVTAAGKPTPPEVMALLDREGPKALDPDGMFGWYAIAREAAAAGDVEQATDALRHALTGWSNPPLGYVRLWEQDTYWGDVAHHPDTRRLYEAKRARIGPVYGQLFYFPGW